MGYGLASLKGIRMKCPLPNIRRSSGRMNVSSEIHLLNLLLLLLLGL